LGSFLKIYPVLHKRDMDFNRNSYQIIIIEKIFGIYANVIITINN